MILPVLTGVRVSVEPKSDRAHFFTYGYKFSGKNINVEFLLKIPGNIPTYDVIQTSVITITVLNSKL